MFYQVMIEIAETSSKTGKRQLFELDKDDLAKIETDVVIPFLKNETFQFDGYFINPGDVKRLLIKETKESVKVYSEYENNNMPPNIIMYVSPSAIVSYDKYTKDITKDVLASAKQKLLPSTRSSSDMKTKNDVDKTSIFVVHGRDELAKTTVARFLEKLGFTAIILHEQPSAGRTIIEKIEAYSNVGFAIVIYTPDDVGAKEDKKPDLKPRARQNVVFEHGYLIGKLGRNNVCALLKGDIEKPSDISGIVYVNFDDRGAWNTEVAKEMLSAGYKLDFNRLLT
jgi:predicted nucleotide-binding protein